MSHTPWNKGRAVGQKTPLRQHQVWRIRRALEKRHCDRDRALFSLALDSMLRSSDLLALTVGAVCGEQLKPKARLSFRQQKTGRTVEVELTPYTRDALSEWIGRAEKERQDYLFTGRGDPHGPALSAAQYRKLVKGWVAMIGLNPEEYSTHSLRRTLPALVYRETKNIEAVRHLLGQSSVTATSHYLNIGGKESLDLARQYRL